LGAPLIFSKFSKNYPPVLWKPIIRSMKNFRFEVWEPKSTCMPNFIKFWKCRV